MEVRTRCYHWAATLICDVNPWEPACRTVQGWCHDVGLCSRHVFGVTATSTRREETHDSEIMPARQALNVPAGIARNPRKRAMR